MKPSALTNRVAATSSAACLATTYQRIFSFCRGVSKLPAKLCQIHAVLRRFSWPDENHRNVLSVALLQHYIFIHIYFAQHRSELAQ
jgi:hypothetical protein